MLEREIKYAWDGTGGYANHKSAGEAAHRRTVRYARHELRLSGLLGSHHAH